MMSSLCVALLAVLVLRQVQVIVSDLSNDCRPKFPGYHVDKSHDAIYQGCYHNRGKDGVLPASSIVTFRKTIDWVLWQTVEHAKDMVQRCGEIALKKNVLYFGVEYYGECYFGNKPDFTQGRVTQKDGCGKCQYDVGGPDVMVVYRLAIRKKLECETVHVGYRVTEKQWAMSLGCYNNVNYKPGVFPHESKINNRLNIDWHKMGDRGDARDMIGSCGREAIRRGFQYFGQQFFGDCYFGNKPNLENQGAVTADPSRNCDKCYWDAGSQTAMLVFQIKNSDSVL